MMEKFQKQELLLSAVDKRDCRNVSRYRVISLLLQNSAFKEK
jgi:hypothetical protein